MAQSCLHSVNLFGSESATKKKKKIGRKENSVLSAAVSTVTAFCIMNNEGIPRVQAEK